MLGKQVRHRRAREEILEACWDLARHKGLAGFSLREVAQAVGVQAPSLYSYFLSKNAMYDAMFADGNRAFVERMRQVPTPGSAREVLLAAATAFVGFCVEDPARHQLLFQRTVPGFEPSDESYAIAVEAITLMRESFAPLGITDPADLDIWTALLCGLAAQQLANDPGGDRWTDLVPAAVDMYVHAVCKETP
ncbi:TetR/AcrR family transcriptional regulator [Leekyejoonella antrihumi]|uniref:TetR/AcrR family transcriptional regulator n=1 Tax=Leekyejoonella antrihumi TaxID=1660198 RepID=UPI001C96261B|nr:TetR/AcrR family transcriptional regulator [Leekyejoonella antrihumi]